MSICVCVFIGGINRGGNKLTPQQSSIWPPAKSSLAIIVICKVVVMSPARLTVMGKTQVTQAPKARQRYITGEITARHLIQVHDMSHMYMTCHRGT